MANRKKTTLGVVHVTATSPKTKLTEASLRAMHKARGFSDIGYNEWISKDGTLHKGRGVEAVGAHVSGFNSISYGISLEGGVNSALKGDVTTITDAQWTTLERRMKEITKKYPQIGWCGHRDLSPDKDGDGLIEPHEWLKECPCFDVIPWAASKGLPTADIKGKWDIIKLPSDRDTKPIVEVYEGPDTRNAYLQRLLTKAGFPVGDDGIVGPKTKAAIEAFQRVHGLKVTKAFDETTVKYLRELLEAPAPLKPIVKTEDPTPAAPELKQPEKPVSKQPTKTWWQWLFGL